jgi:hypothetical protein
MFEATSAAPTERGCSMAIRTPRKLLVLVQSIMGQNSEGNIEILQRSGRVGQNPEAYEDLSHLDAACRFQGVSIPRSETLRIPDEILDYYGWVFCQGGFLNLHMTFEQFLTVVAAFRASGIRPEYDDSESVISVRLIDA